MTTLYEYYRLLKNFRVKKPKHVSDLSLKEMESSTETKTSATKKKTSKKGRIIIRNLSFKVS